MPNWINNACLEYLKRFNRDYRVVLQEIKPASRNNKKNTEQILAIEEARIREAIPDPVHLIILDEHGKGISSMELVDLVEQWRDRDISPCFVIGGANGISAALKKDSIFSLQISKMTLPHGLARVILVEQLYRATSIINRHPYHRI